jgi:excisionase family DNA binding protein
LIAECIGEWGVAVSKVAGKDGGKDRGSTPGPTHISSSRTSAGEQLSEVRFLTVAEVATVMRVSKMTVYRIVHAGELPAVRVGRSFRVPEKAVHDYLRAAFIEAG